MTINASTDTTPTPVLVETLGFLSDMLPSWKGAPIHPREPSTTEWAFFTSLLVFGLISQYIMLPKMMAKVCFYTGIAPLTSLAYMQPHRNPLYFIVFVCTHWDTTA